MVQPSFVSLITFSGVSFFLVLLINDGAVLSPMLNFDLNVLQAAVVPFSDAYFPISYRSFSVYFLYGFLSLSLQLRRQSMQLDDSSFQYQNLLQIIRFLLRHNKIANGFNVALYNLIHT